MHALLRFCVPAAVGLLLAIAPRVASAIPAYPGDLDTALGVTYLDSSDCIICHHDNSGGLGTVVQPFGMAMVAAGLTDDSASLPGALATFEAECTGATDIQQLKAGFDPNTGACLSGACGSPLPDAGCAASSDELPLYGCGAQLAPGASGVAGAGSAILLASMMLGASRARRRRRRR
jgi:hypothetical protein